MVPVTAKVIVSPSLASASAWRNEPAPLSLVLVTIMVVARAGMIGAQSSTAAMAADLIPTKDLNFVSVDFVFMALAPFTSFYRK
ncbi:MAG: hypothetical protein DMF11_01330 [Verrucomicrobia bacterium]|nr:MAG: hypothetical protein DMF11_01330 [Verrucomicrobiota bacterium]